MLNKTNPLVNDEMLDTDTFHEVITDQVTNTSSDPIPNTDSTSPNTTPSSTHNFNLSTTCDASPVPTPRRTS